MCLPGDSKWPFDPLVGGHLAFQRVTDHHPKKVTSRIARYGSKARKLLACSLHCYGFYGIFFSFHQAPGFPWSIRTSNSKVVVANHLGTMQKSPVVSMGQAGVVESNPKKRHFEDPKNKAPFDWRVQPGILTERKKRVPQE